MVVSPSSSDEHESSLLRDYSALPPRLVVRLGEALIRGCYAFLDAIIPPPMRMADLAFTSYTIAEVIRTMAALGVPDLLAAGPKTAAELAAELGGAHEERLFRLLRYAAVHGVVDTHPGSRTPPQTAQSVRFRNNRLSAVLREDHPNSQKHMVLAVVSRQHLAGGWAELEWGVRTGGLMFERHYGEPFFRHLTAVEGLEATYSRGMANLDHTCAASIVSDYDWGKHARFVDIGGAYGSFLSDLLSRHPGSTGVLFDQSQVIRRAEKTWEAAPERAGLLPRMSFVSGDFFKPETLPKAEGGGTVYMMRQILHDWPDAETLEILRSVRVAMGGSACTLALVEAVILPSRSPTSDFMNRARCASDLHMMVQHDGKERDTHQWRSILEAAGFTMTRIVSTRSIFSVVEAVPTPQ